MSDPNGNILVAIVLSTRNNAYSKCYFYYFNFTINAMYSQEKHVSDSAICRQSGKCALIICSKPPVRWVTGCALAFAISGHIRELKKRPAASVANQSSPLGGSGLKKGNRSDDAH